ncbi:hypothetical protein CBR_g50810 [Chara braunii]|uniref:Clp R domain-containing protein n=1 Tax=Chara braunii TaxID=69332 RepID=A0A388M799_CHABU|nr:hypothetical protein CBR_g50810 [Chara braunii]|eukprot:GBG90464.1 hypothetical protein CBR_g50810 [Chara braunii]
MAGTVAHAVAVAKVNATAVVISSSAVTQDGDSSSRLVSWKGQSGAIVPKACLPQCREKKQVAPKASKSLTFFAGFRKRGAVDFLGTPGGRYCCSHDLASLVRKSLVKGDGGGRGRRGVAVAMFERFTEKAIKVIMLAQEEARRLGHNFVGTEQVLLGLIGEGTGIAAKVLKSMGVNLKEARVEVEKIIGRGSGFVAVEIPFTPRAKRVLELSLEEARQLVPHQFRLMSTEQDTGALPRRSARIAVCARPAVPPRPKKLSRRTTPAASNTAFTVQDATGDHPAYPVRGANEPAADYRGRLLAFSDAVAAVEARKEIAEAERQRLANEAAAEAQRTTETDAATRDRRNASSTESLIACEHQWTTVLQDMIFEMRRDDGLQAAVTEARNRAERMCRRDGVTAGMRVNDTYHEDDSSTGTTDREVQHGERDSEGESEMSDREADVQSWHGLDQIRRNHPLAGPVERGPEVNLRQRGDQG